MEQIKHMKHQQSVRLYAVTVLFLFLFCGVSPETAQGQWTTGTNINNTNTGNVGIGTGTPPSKLTVSGGNIHVQTPTLVSNGSMGDIGFGPGGGVYGGIGPRAFMRGYFQGASWYNGSALAFFTHAGNDITNGDTYLLERMRIDKDGNVGIGTSSPASKLQIYNGGTNSRSGLSIDAQGTQNSQQAELNLFTLGDGTKDAVTAGTKGWHLAARGNAYVGAGEQNDLQLYSWNGSTATIRQYWDAAGNVGIGTLMPSSSLHVYSTTSNPALTVESSAAISPTLEFRDGAATQNRWRVGSGMVTQTDGKFGVFDARQGQHRFVIDAVGNVGIGKTSPTVKLDVDGDLTVSGTINGGTINAKYQDVAEWVESSQKLEAGTVVALDTEKSNQVLASSEAYDTRVAGVVSAQPGISLGEGGAGKVLVATTGRVKVKVDATRAAIKIGDLLVTSDVVGVAMKSEAIKVGSRRIHSPGTIIGKALEPLAKGTGEILVLLSLQ
jgi:hypothetical protein